MEIKLDFWVPFLVVFAAWLFLRRPTQPERERATWKPSGVMPGGKTTDLKQTG